MRFAQLQEIVQGAFFVTNIIEIESQDIADDLGRHMGATFVSIDESSAVYAGCRYRDGNFYHSAEGDAIGESIGLTPITEVQNQLRALMEGYASA